MRPTHYCIITSVLFKHEYPSTLLLYRHQYICSPQPDYPAPPSSQPRLSGYYSAAPLRIELQSNSAADTRNQNFKMPSYYRLMRQRNACATQDRIQTEQLSRKMHTSEMLSRYWLLVSLKLLQFAPAMHAPLPALASVTRQRSALPPADTNRADLQGQHVNVLIINRIICVKNKRCLAPNDTYSTFENFRWSGRIPPKM